MKLNAGMIAGLGLSTLLVGCNSQPVISDALQGALEQVTRSAGIATGSGNGSHSSNSSDFLSPQHARNKCRYNRDDKCAQDFGVLKVTTEINRNNVTLVRYGSLVEGVSGGLLKESKVSEQMFPYIDRGLIDFETNIYITGKTQAVRPGRYYFKGQYGNQNPSLAVGDITISPGVTNIIHVTYN